MNKDQVGSASFPFMASCKTTPGPSSPVRNGSQRLPGQVQSHRLSGIAGGFPFPAVDVVATSVSPCAAH
jgi:hypothetical protein